MKIRSFYNFSRKFREFVKYAQCFEIFLRKMDFYGEKNVEILGKNDSFSNTLNYYNISNFATIRGGLPPPDPCWDRVIDLSGHGVPRKILATLWLPHKNFQTCYSLLLFGFLRKCKKLLIQA